MEKILKTGISFLICFSLLLTGFDIRAAASTSKYAEEEVSDDRIIPGDPERPSSKEDNWKGDYIYFGKWYNKAIKWRVLKNDGKNLLLMTDQSAGSLPYLAVEEYDVLAENQTIFWENSTLRKWLNETFYSNAFSEEEKEYLQENKVSNGRVDENSADSGPDTYDKVYILSKKEFGKTKFGFWGRYEAAKSRQFIKETAGSDYYEKVWTRSMAENICNMGVHSDFAYWFDTDGSVASRGFFLTEPVMWDKEVHPVIKIPVSCPYWTNDDPDLSAPVASASSNPDDSDEEEDDLGKVSIKGLDVEFTIPSEVPVIGGNEMNLDFGKLPIEFDMERTEHGGEFRAGFGIKFKNSKKGLFDLEPEEWGGLKKAVEKAYNNKTEEIDDDVLLGKNGIIDARDKVNSRVKSGKSAIGSVVSDVDKKIEITAGGFAEGTIEEGKVRSIGGGIWINFKFKASQNQQAIIMSVPVVIKGELGINADLHCSLGFDLQNASFYSKGDLEVEFPALKVSLGIGIAYIADVSVYGSLKNILKLEGGENGASDRSRFTATIEGEVGLSATVLNFSTKKVLWGGGKNGNGKYTFIDTRNIKKGSNAYFNVPSQCREADYKLNRADFAKQSPWYTCRNAKRKQSSGEDDETVLQSGVYSAPGVKMVTTDDGLTMMVYVADIEERSTGNHTAVVYSIYDSENKTWGVPKILDDDGTADYYPDIITDGKDIYVAWTDNSRDDFSEDVSLEEMAETCETSVAKYDIEKETFSVHTLTSNDSVDIRPILGILDGKIGVIWLNNDNSDILNFEGDNSLFYSLYQQDEWSEASQYVSCEDCVIKSYGIGMAGKKECIAYMTDKDKDYTSAGDTELYAGQLDEAPFLFESDIEPEQGIQFANINGVKMLTWYGDGTVAYTTNLSSANALFQSTLLSSKYQIVSSGKKALLLFAACDQDSQQDGTAIYACTSENGSFFSPPVKWTYSENYINSYAVSIKEDGYQMVYARDNIELNDEDFQKTTDLCSKDITSFHSVYLGDIAYNEEDVRPGEKLPISIFIKNNGMVKEKKVKLIATSGEKVLLNSTLNRELEIGSTVSGDVSIPLPEEISADTTIQIRVEPTEGENISCTEDTREIKIGKTDLALLVDEDLENKEVEVKVVNGSNIASDAVLRVRDTDENGDVLKEMELGEIEAGEESATKFSFDDLLGEEGRAVYFEVVSDQDEIYSANNFAYRYLDERKLASEAPVTPPASGQPDGEAAPSSSGVPDGTANPAATGIPNNPAFPLASGTAVPDGSFSASPQKSPAASASPSIKPTTKPDTSYDSYYTTTYKKKEVSKPAKVKLKSCKSRKKGRITVKWRRASKADGYQIQYARKRSFAGKKTMRTYRKSCTLRVKSKKKYYVRVRAYRYGNIKFKVYGKWSRVKKVKVK